MGYDDSVYDPPDSGLDTVDDPTDEQPPVVPDVPPPVPPAGVIPPKMMEQE